MTYYLKAGMNVVIEAGVQITLKVGGNFIDINPAGVVIQGTMVLINSGGSAGSASPGTIVPPTDPEEAHVADNADPGSDAPTYKNQIRAMPPEIVPSYTAPWHNPNDPNNKKKDAWIEVELVDEDDNPVPGQEYRITLPDGKTIAEGTLNEEGKAKVTNIDPGTCKVTFPKLDQEVWTEA
jgi:type VI secretion system secreted protein VgrG